MRQRTHIEDLERTLPKEKLEKIRKIDQDDASLYSMLEKFQRELEATRLALHKATDQG